MMKYLVAITRGVHRAVGISLPKPEQERAVAIIWLIALLILALIVLGTGWLVLSSMSSSMNSR
jgi:hypothetical protein